MKKKSVPVVGDMLFAGDVLGGVVIECSICGDRKFKFPGILVTKCLSCGARLVYPEMASW
jgi:hypothetical protein